MGGQEESIRAENILHKSHQVVPYADNVALIARHKAILTENTKNNFGQRDWPTTTSSGNHMSDEQEHATKVA